nr:unnamed protein product [Digitaria exilis]
MATASEGKRRRETRPSKQCPLETRKRAIFPEKAADMKIWEEAMRTGKREGGEEKQKFSAFPTSASRDAVSRDGAGMRKAYK